jgi:hypothetical protein
MSYGSAANYVDSMKGKRIKLPFNIDGFKETYPSQLEGCISDNSLQFPLYFLVAIFFWFVTFCLNPFSNRQFYATQHLEIVVASNVD